MQFDACTVEHCIECRYHDCMKVRISHLNTGLFDVVRNNTCSTTLEERIQILEAVLRMIKTML